MSTRSNILIKCHDTNIWLYRHMDGYPSVTGYNLALTLAHSKSYTDFMNSLLSYKYEPTTFSKALPVYGITTEQHGDVEYLYKFEFDRSMPHFVKVQVFSVGWGDDEDTCLIDTEFSISPENVQKHLKYIFDKRKMEEGLN